VAITPVCECSNGGQNNALRAIPTPRPFIAPLSCMRSAVHVAGHRTALQANVVVLNNDNSFPLVLKQFIGGLLFCQDIRCGLEMMG
jgi:hypothetical protein